MNNLGNQNMLTIFLLVVLLWYLLSPERGNEETFDPTVTEFVPAGDLRHDLRGYPIKSSPYLGVVHPLTNSNVVLSSSCGEMYRSTAQPGVDYKQVECPPIDAYDGDTCWKSTRGEPTAPLFKEPTSCPTTKSIWGDYAPQCRM